MNPDSLRGSRTGVYAGVGGNEYRDLFQASNREQSYLGTNGSVAVGRVAFALGLQRGEVDRAMAGGVNAILPPSASRFMVEIGMLSPAGHCRPFDASAERPLLVGSVKSNVGHMESAAGMAALIKTVLSMNRGVIPRHLHFNEPSPHVEWERLPVRVASEKTAWPDGNGRLPLHGRRHPAQEAARRAQAG